MSAPLLDSHAHLADPAFAEDLPAVLARAAAAGVGAVVAVSETPEEVRAVLALGRRFPGRVWPAAGLFPSHLAPARAAEVEALAREHRDELVAIGEVGLDRWLVKEEDGRRRQREILARFVALARELDLPLNVHSRAAGHHTVAFLREHDARRVQLHAFDGRAAAALPAVEAGYFFSIPPSVVRSPQKRRLVARLPLGCLLLETDSPVLGPRAEQRNEPANLRLALAEVAAIKGLPEAAVAAAVSDNTRRLYGRLPPPLEDISPTRPCG